MVSTVLRAIPVALAVALTLSAFGCGGSSAPRPDLVFVSTRDGDYAIFEMNADGGSQRRLTDERGDDSSPRKLFFQIEPAWSPDAEKIAFASRRAGTFDIFVMNADGTGSQRVTTTDEDDSHPTWSPDGRRIAFARNRPGDIYVANADGSAARRISDPEAEEFEPAWSPDGGWIAYVRREAGTTERELWLVRPDGSRPRQITSLRARSVSPAWSSDSKRLAFASNVRGPLYDLFVLTVGEKGVRRLTRSGPDAFEPAWSPDGASVGFTQNGAIHTVDLDGQVEKLTDPDDNDSFPAWNPRPPADD